ncbi:arginine N-succinyltransferase [Amphritea sp. 1_MG-2023]|uniref:arginine N-succinyltransferase n=1 Tax=Amphritea sp. 1_MG-2023 TaxID=3062670 RepID=UPI0026E2739D|nr:arginine N-succinyltransferase [Amphritea sp. 1_MG-2023]MDO6564807.1 arginine N-succinyltransferase [Amphritea sp. 1_MG-2023]
MNAITIIRPIRQSDLERLCEMAHSSGPGFTSLPNNRDLLQAKINASEQAFQQTVADPLGASYLFVLEEIKHHHVIGICGIEAAVGLREPFYHYRLGTVVHASRELGVHNQFKTLYLCNDYTGSTEVCSLYLEPEYRQHNNGALLSRCRFLFIAQFRERFPGKVIAEMRGVSNTEGRSPFWDGLGQHFFSMEFSEADYLTGIGNKGFIAELMPKHSIYIHLLPESARQVIGEVHKNTLPARKMLESEGFRYEEYIDIFDAGPTLACEAKDIRAIRKSRHVEVYTGPYQSHNTAYLVSNTSLHNFRSTVVDTAPSEGRLTLPAELLHQLHVSDGDKVRVVPLKRWS